MPHAPLPAPFRRLAWSNLAAQSAEQLALAASPLLAVIAFKADAAEAGWLQTAQTLPFLLFALPAGLLADRMARKHMMATSEALRAATLLALLGLLASDALNLPWLAVLGFAGTAGSVAYGVAAPALVPALVPRADLARANARMELARTLAFSGGPALAGWMLGLLEPWMAYALAAALSAFAALSLAGLPEPERLKRAARHPIAELREGAAFLFGHDLLRPIFATQLTFNAALFALQAIYAPYAITRLGLSPGETGFTLALYGIGMVAGALAAPRIAALLPLGAMILVGPICGLLASFCLIGTLAWPHILPAGLCFLLLGLGPILWTISTTTLRQSVTPVEMLGRVSALALVTLGARPIGAGLGALIAQNYGVAACLIAIGIGFALQLCFIALSPVRRLRALPA